MRRASAPGLPLKHRQLNLVRKKREMTGEPVKQLALVVVRCTVADSSAFRCVFPELSDLRQVVLHGPDPP